MSKIYRYQNMPLWKMSKIYRKVNDNAKNVHNISLHKHVIVENVQNISQDNNKAKKVQKISLSEHRIVENVQNISLRNN